MVAAGRLIAYVKDAAPVTSKVAAEVVPVVVGIVTPPAPPVDNVPDGSIITEPGAVDMTARLPKLRSVVFINDIGVIIVAVPAAATEACAKLEKAEEVSDTIARKAGFRMFILLLKC